MSKAVSALDGAKFEGFVTIREAGLQGMVTLRADLGAAKTKAAVKKIAGVPQPEARAITHGKSVSVAWMSPDELLLLMPHETADDVVAKLGVALKGQHHLAVNVSDARAMFTISGPGARDVLAKLVPADMGAITVGEIRRTRLAQAAAAFWTTNGQDFTLVTFRSTATYVFNLLNNAAQPGSEVGYHKS